MNGYDQDKVDEIALALMQLLRSTHNSLGEAQRCKKAVRLGGSASC